MAAPKIPVSKTDPARVTYIPERDTYKRAVGEIAPGKPKLFLLPTPNELEARDKGLLKLHRLWIEQEAKGHKVWTQEALAVAEAIRKGQKAVEVEPVEFQLGLRVDGVNMMEPTNRAFTQSKVEAHSNSIIPVILKKTPLELWNGAPKVGQSLYDALDAYAVYIKATFKTQTDKVEDSSTTAWGNNFAKSVLRTKSAINDLDLSLFGLMEIESIVHYWKQRPYRKGSTKKISIDTVSDQISSLKRFVKWVHKNPAWKWRKPADLDFEDKLFMVNPKALMTNTELSNKAKGAKVYSIPELQVIWRYATQNERYLIVIALNCAFAAAEHYSLRLKEVFFDEGQIRRVRIKSGVHGEFALWPETLAALQWMAGKRVIAPDDYLLVNEKGGQVTYTHIANTWGKVIKRIKKDLPDFKFLPFKHLRKTSGTLVQKTSTGETASVHLSRRKRVATDDEIDRYTPRDYEKAWEAQTTVRQQLQPMFDEGPALPFNGDMKGKTYISLGTTKKVVELLLAGIHKEEIARQLKVSRATVYRDWDKIKPPKEEIVEV